MAGAALLALAAFSPLYAQAAIDPNIAPRAATLDREGERQMAIDLLGHYLATAPDDGRAWLQLGRFYLFDARDWHVHGHRGDPDVSPCCVPRNPRGPEVEASFDPQQPQFQVPRKVIKGGSFLCADSYCRRYRPAARRPQMMDTGMSHIGTRCVVRPAAEPAVT